jgi:uncharacterized repeat protein (TIGR03803 family)
MKTTAVRITMLVLSFNFAAGQQYKVLWSFGGPPNDGQSSLASLTFDGVGNLYGTTQYGGTSGGGTVFELSPTGDGSWNEAILYNFCTNKNGVQCLDGEGPAAGLVLDSRGNLYGTTENGGGQPCPSDLNGCGTVFELSPSSAPGGSWTQTVLYSFCASELNGQCLDGSHPLSQLIFDASGNLFGTTMAGGTGHLADSFDDGVIFQLSPGANSWKETVLYDFCSTGQGNYCPDGVDPQAGLTFDKSGNLYGTTSAGGAPSSVGGGTVYKLSPSGNGWIETVLYAFRAPYLKGSSPVATVSFDTAGNLYSTVELKGAGDAGGVFRVDPSGSGSEDTFSFNGEDGDMPTAGVLVDSEARTLYGTTSDSFTFGTVFKIEAPANETVLYDFCAEPDCADGSSPFAAVIQDQSGNLYGTTYLGGLYNFGVVFEIAQ